MTKLVQKSNSQNKLFPFLLGNSWTRQPTQVSRILNYIITSWGNEWNQWLSGGVVKKNTSVNPKLHSMQFEYAQRLSLIKLS